jgi:hypothetical protein
VTWKVTGAHIVSETIADEVIVVDLVDGSYFSLSGCAIAIWDYVKTGYSRTQILETLSATLDSTPADMDRHLDDFINSLIEEKLIEPKSADGVSVSNITSTDKKVAFAVPALQKYTDMEDVLKMDPIHDFDEMGWPHQPAATAQIAN